MIFLLLNFLNYNRYIVSLLHTLRLPMTLTRSARSRGLPGAAAAAAAALRAEPIAFFGSGRAHDAGAGMIPAGRACDSFYTIHESLI